MTNINSLSSDILQYIMKHLTDRQLKQSCLRVNKQWNQCASKALKNRSPITQFPDEILLRLFNYYLNPYDLFHSCVTVSKQWKFIINEKTIWKTVNSINWARGQWDSNIPLEQTTITTDQNRLEMNEIRLIGSFVKYFLPCYGYSIENLILYGSSTINDNTVIKYIQRNSINIKSDMRKKIKLILKAKQNKCLKFRISSELCALQKVHGSYESF
ncbi:unnamed protein product [Rotaria magnacalcarata]|uniref:F-box domain-containing protein n=1 Tax=Rotaria magnacalcarata TaxID=392030 RepID=A0A816GD19_9BILA|nr:unnamed protein product [Rotaria magnacalcarata]